MKFDLTNLTRKNIRELKPYSSARHEFTGNATVCLDANENAYGSPLDSSFNRYPDPLQWQLKFQLAKIKGVPAENIFIGNGSDEVIDIAYRIFCEPEKDNVIICPPTYGMYEVSANINAVEIRKVNLTSAFQLDVEAILAAADSKTKLLFICSPNNPTGNSMNRTAIKKLLEEFNGIVVIDEAYINYAAQQTFIEELTVYPNLIVMQTLSKAWGLAALRLGLAYAAKDIIDLLNKVKPPYNINAASQQLAIEALQNIPQVNAWISATVEQRKYVAEQLLLFSFVEKVYPADANFLLVKVIDAGELYQYLISHGIITRNRSTEPGCANCLRITIGTPVENEFLLNTLKEYKP